MTTSRPTKLRKNRIWKVVSSAESWRPAIAIAVKETSAPDIQSAARITGVKGCGDTSRKSRLVVVRGWIWSNEKPNSTTGVQGAGCATGLSTDESTHGDRRWTCCCAALLAILAAG